MWAPTRSSSRQRRTSLAQALPVRILDIDGLNEIVAKDGAQTLAECAGHPLLVIGEYEQGRAAAFASDIAPHWASPGFTQWSGYGTLFDRLVRWVAGEDLG